MQNGERQGERAGRAVLRAWGGFRESERTFRVQVTTHAERAKWVRARASISPHRRNLDNARGKLHFGETFEQGAEREVLEETGIQVKKMKVISLANNIVPDAHFVTVGFLCEDFGGEPKVKEPDEITEWQWFDLEQLPEPVFPPSREILDNYLSNKFYSG